MFPSLQYFILSSLVMIGIAYTGARWLVESSYRAAANSVCRLVGEHYYRNQEPRVISWVERCHVAADHETFRWPVNLEVERINRRLDLLEISHLTLYSPIENRQIWENEGLDTGLRARMIDGQLVVVGILPGSAAEQVGVRPGDVLLTINQHEVNSSHAAQTGAGEFKFERAKKQILFAIQPTELVENLAPYLEPLSVVGEPQAHASGTTQDSGCGVGYLRIPSFLGPYFDKGVWLGMTRHFNDYKKIVIDVRGNAGGSFPAMLRAISPFRCDEPKIGQLFHVNSRHSNAALPDDLDADLQLEQLSQSDIVQLRSFNDYGCFNGPVVVLIDAETSSVAEIFAQAFFLRQHAHVLGQPSAGQVVMAQWFPITALGRDDFSLSVPIAGYRSLDGVELENRALEPERVLHYDLLRAKAGRDSWLDEAAIETARDGFRTRFDR